MGLNTKQVSRNGVDWTKTLLQAQSVELPKPPIMRRTQLAQNQQQPPEKCPRCDSMNTKFCYYNNYNKSQPRYFCKTCKRHWTKGGTLRNVPIGGGRKNKRLKTVNNNTSTTASSTTSCMNNLAMQSEQQCQNISLLHGDKKVMSETLYDHLQRSYTNRSTSTNGIFLGSISSLSQHQHPIFSFPSSSGSFDSNLVSISTSNQSLNTDAFAAEESKIMDDLTVTTFMPITSCDVITQPCQVPSMDTTSFLNWEDIDSLVSSDLTTTWDDAENKTEYMNQVK